jgi:hypothetical protein
MFIIATIYLWVRPEKHIRIPDLLSSFWTPASVSPNASVLDLYEWSCVASVTEWVFISSIVFTITIVFLTISRSKSDLLSFIDDENKIKKYIYIYYLYLKMVIFGCICNSFLFLHLLTCPYHSCVLLRAPIPVRCQPGTIILACRNRPGPSFTIKFFNGSY